MNYYKSFNLMISQKADSVVPVQDIDNEEDWNLATIKLQQN